MAFKRMRPLRWHTFFGAAWMLLAASGARAQAGALTGAGDSFRAALASGDMGSLLVGSFLAGVATSLTPCVYPMIAITVSIFGARTSESRAHAAMLSTSFVLGMATLFTPLGLFAATTGAVFGAALANPYVIAALAGFFLLLAASMFGLFELDLPSSLKTRLADVGGMGVKGAFALGMVSAIIAAPCTGPVLGLLLTWVGTTGSLAFGAAGLFSYALGLGMLFWVVGTFSVSLPKSGRWLEMIKSGFGIVMVVTAFYYLRPLLLEPDVVEGEAWWLGAALALSACGVAAGALHLTFTGSTAGIRVRKGFAVALTVAGLSALIGHAQAPNHGAGELAWREDYAAAREQALREGRPLLIDFSASWCGACGELDRHTFAAREVIREARDFITVRVDLSPGSITDAKEDLLASYNQRGLPLVVLHDPSGKEVSRVTGFVEAADFLKLMRQAQR